MLMSVFSYTRNARKTKFAEPKVYNLFSLNLLFFLIKLKIYPSPTKISFLILKTLRLITAK